MSELLNCPFCGLDVTNDEGCFPLNREKTAWEVSCGNPECFGHSPDAPTREEAIAKWNRRPDPAPVGVRVPDKIGGGLTGADNFYNDGWNDCRAETLRLNPQPGAVVGEIRKVAKRNLRSLIELGSDDKTLMLRCLEELS